MLWSLNSTLNTIKKTTENFNHGKDITQFALRKRITMAEWRITGAPCYWNSTWVQTVTYGFPGGSDGKESACHAGDLGLIPKSGRSPEEYPLQYFGLENSMVREGLTWGCKELDMTERLTFSLSESKEYCIPNWFELFLMRVWMGKIYPKFYLIYLVPESKGGRVKIWIDFWFGAFLTDLMEWAVRRTPFQFTHRNAV